MPWITHFLDVLFPPRDTERLVRACTPDTLSALIAPTLIEETLSPVTALLSYREPLVHALIVEGKYHANTRAQRLLGTILHDYLADWCSEEQGVDTLGCILIPLPLSRARFRARGYNQVEVVVRAGISPAAPYTLQAQLLERLRDTAPQTTLKRRERLRNMKDAFRVLDHSRPLSKEILYLVVDDVVTTGATLHAAKAALMGAGATHVELLALAH